MKAFQLVAHGAPGRFELRDVPDPAPGPGEAVVRVRACGLNHLDLWAEQSGLPMPLELPLTPGGEVAGEVAEVGPGIHGWQIGDRVAVQSNITCGECEFCLRSEDAMCLKSQLLGVQRNGGFAEKVLVPARSLVALPEEIGFETSAALTLAASTAMHMLTHRVQVRQGDWVLVIGGAGGVGSAAVQIAKKMGAYVIATGSTEPKRNLALKLGAEYAVDSTHEDWPAEVRKITQRRGVDIVVENVGGEVLLKCFECLARGGAIVTCGATMGREVVLKLWPFFVKQHSLIGSYGRNRADLVTTLQWAAEGALRPVIHKIYPLGETAEAFQQLRNRQVLGKLLIQPLVK